MLYYCNCPHSTLYAMKILSTYLERFVFFVFVVKIGFLITLVGHAILQKTAHSPQSKALDSTIVWMHHYTELIFDVGMGLLLIYYFWRGSANDVMSDETMLLMFLYGCITCIQKGQELIHTIWSK